MPKETYDPTNINSTAYISETQLSPDTTLPPRSQLLKIGDIAGMYYPAEQNLSRTVVIYGIGAPLPPDMGLLPDAPIILAHNVDVFVPDYIGYGRSDGEFTPENCIRTFTDLNREFHQGTVGRNRHRRIATELQYDRVIFVGRSFGAFYTPILPRFDPTITEVAAFCPVLDSKNQGSYPGEEDNEGFMGSMAEDGYHHLYRGVLDERWIRHLEGGDGLSPMDNISSVGYARIFIAHGMQDPVVHWGKSVQYLEKLKAVNPATADNYQLRLYPNGDHGKSTTNPAMEDLLEWLGV